MKYTLSLLIGALLLVGIFAACPNNCNAAGGGGRCVNNQCVCNNGYYGADCTFNVRQLQPGASQRSNLVMGSWDYYQVITPDANKDMTIEMIQETTPGVVSDCDLYVKYNNIPTTSSYDYRDLSFNTTVRLIVPRAAQGQWFVGVQAFLRCDYTIKVTLGGSCPNGCGENGDCIDGVCRCRPPYSGPTCSSRYNDITLDQTVTGSVTALTWQYYHLRLADRASKMSIVLSQTGGTNPDLDLYVRFGETPTFSSWDYANASLNAVSYLNITAPQQGSWYIGVWAYSCGSENGCPFTLSVKTEDRCPNRCSMRGTCLGTTCSCSPGFEGPYCETLTAPMSMGVEYTGYVDDEAWNYYRINTASMNPVVFNVNQFSTGDCDIYVRGGNQRPTRIDFDYQELTTNRSFSLTIPQPGTQTYWVGIYGFRRCDYSIVPTYASNTGNCLNGGSRPSPSSPCVCPAGFGGDRCEVTVLSIAAGSTITGTVERNTWKYFNLTVQGNPSDVIIYLRETDAGTNGNVWLFSQTSTVPTLTEHEYEDVDYETRYHTIHIERGTRPVHGFTTIIGVYGSPSIVQERGAGFQMIAWVSPF